MPELPEVETIVRDLRPQLVGRTFTRADLVRESVLRFSEPASFRVRTEGRRIGSVHRRGKFIHLGLNGGDDLVVHLGMTGTLTLQSLDEPRAVHTHLVLDLDDQRQLRYRDPRRFGRVLLGRPGQLQASGALPNLGPEPLSPHFAISGFAEALRASGRQVKSVLLDQAMVAGCGNIYADEACFLARIRPDRRAHTLTRSEAGRLALALPVVMREAVRLRGTSFSDYRDGFGAKGEAFEALFVYGRGGLPCVRCGGTLRQTRVGGRTTVYCHRCQR
ncbi:MAG TPA: bifunctional DNA-formamidopyrimidine glycosylase/DNA-(apurinic or apyrimidinic site) lyase [Candidatus Dormibacteraeota bacterium]|nr:bifunctional DNA-formamidopyrimidine glycosylase/DNA-(apurinic or apyrimidinic site) lyase [Candidatus Dormibacteraeota bacterium]